MSNELKNNKLNISNNKIIQVRDIKRADNNNNIFFINLADIDYIEFIYEENLYDEKTKCYSNHIEYTIPEVIIHSCNKFYIRLDMDQFKKYIAPYIENLEYNFE